MNVPIKSVEGVPPTGGGTPFLRFDYPSDVIALLESSLVILEADESLLGASPERIFLYSASNSSRNFSDVGLSLAAKIA